MHTPSNTFTGTWYVTPGSNTTAATTYGYDQHGNQSTITDNGSHTWTSTYNLLGQVTGKTDPDSGATTAMTYDSDGNLLQQTNANGAANGTVSFTYDALNRKTAEYASPVSGQVAWTSSSSPGNQMAAWVYDNANAAVTGMKFPVGHLTTETTYSGAGNGGTVVPYVVQLSNFNVFGEPLGEKYTIPATAATTGLSGSYSFSHSWTVTKGLPLGDFYPATTAAGLPSESTSRTFLSSPLDLVKGLGGTVAGYAQNTTYDAYGDVLDELIGKDNNLADIVSTFDPHTLRLTDQLVKRDLAMPSHVDEESYAYDLYGNVTSQTSSQQRSALVTETQCYQYDGLDQLTQAWTANDNCATTPTTASHSMVASGISAASAYWTSWSYDVTQGDDRSDILGEVRQQVQHGLGGAPDTTTSNTFGGANGGPHALTSASTTGGSASASSFGYDAAGNMITRATPANGTQTLTWNAAGQLTQVSGGAGGTTAYLYAPDGSLLLQVNPGSTTLYLDGEQLTATTSGGTITVTGARIIPLPSGGDVVRTGGTTSYFFEIPDPHGTSSLYLDNTAQSPTWRQFTPYGAPRGTSQAWIDNRGFLNKPADASTGLTYVGARAYDPLTAQFISPDPVLAPTDPLDLNAYAYGKGNPIGNSDPTGLCADPSECQLHQKHDGNGFSGSGSSTSSINTTSTGTANTGHSGSTSGGNSWQKTVQWAIRLARSNPCVIDPLLCMGSNSNPIRINAGFLNTSGTAQIPITSCLLLGEMPVCANLAASGGGKSGGGSSGDGSGGAGAVSLITRVLELARALGQGDLTGEQAAAQLSREFSGERLRAIADVRNYYRGTVDSMRATEGAMREAGATDEAVARQLVPMRNAAKVAARDLMNPDEVRELEAYNMGRYNNPVGPDADYLFNKYGSWQQVIDAAYRPDPAINAIADALEASWGGGSPPA